MDNDEAGSVTERELPESAVSLIRRLLHFLRSVVIPGDSWQLVYLVGVIFVFISPTLTWRQPGVLGSRLPEGSRHIIVIAIWPIMIASLVAYFSCFWSSARPVRRLLLGVMLPGLVGAAAIAYALYRAVQTPHSVFEKRSIFDTSSEWSSVNLLKAPPILLVCLIGLVLIAIFTVRVFLRVSALPLALTRRPGELQDSASSEHGTRWLLFRAPDFDDGSQESWDRYRWLIFVLLGPLFLISNAFAMLLFLPDLFRMHSLPESLFTALARISGGVVILGIVVLILGKPSLRMMRECTHLPEPRYALLALALAGCINIAAPVGAYLVARVQWAAFQFGETWPPDLSNFFDWNQLGQASLQLLVVGAFAEEIVFRGILLPRLICRYDLYRGIFLTGIIWAAMHFRFDSYLGMTVKGVLYQLGYRVLFCVSMNYVFAWMTLRWRSVVPAGVAHTVWNVLEMSGVTGSAKWQAEYKLLLWGVAAFVLYRFWPPKVQEAEMATTQPESAHAV